MASSSRVFAAGFHAQAAMAQEFCLQMRRMGWDAAEIVPGLGDYIERVRCITGEDFVIVFDFAPYSSGMMEVVQHLKDRCVPIMLVTDMNVCPYAELCTWVVRCRILHPPEGQRMKEACSISAGIIAGYALRMLARKSELTATDAYEELRDGVFSRFNPYGRIESQQW